MFGRVAIQLCIDIHKSVQRLLNNIEIYKSGGKKSTQNLQTSWCSDNRRSGIPIARCDLLKKL